MIQKPKTKFGYVRRILALPVLFTVAFAYMVNAKNKEIEKVNHDVEKIVQSLEIKNDTEVQPNTENVSVEIIKDTIKPPVSEVSKVNTISNLKITSSVENSWENRLKDADESDIFLVEGKKVSKDDFINFFDENIETPNYIFSHSAPKNDDIKVMIYSAAKNSDQLSSAVRNKLMSENKVGNDMFLYMTKMISTDQERENLRQSVLEAAKARKAAEEAEENRKIEISNNLEFFKNAELQRANGKKASDEFKKELQKSIIAKRESSRLKNNFKKGRDYERNPLTKKEIAELKKEAEEIKIVTEKHYTKSRKMADFGLFKADKQITKVYDLDGNEITLPKAPVVVNTKMFAISTSGADLYVNGKKVNKDEFMKYQDEFKDKDSESKIKEF